MANKSNSDLLLNYHDAVIYSSDIALLDSSTAWLNDACINYQLTRLDKTQVERRDAAKDSVEREQKRQKLLEEHADQLEDLFIDPSVMSFLMHQLTEDDEDYEDELSNLNASWNLPQPPTSGHPTEGMKKIGNDKEIQCKRHTATQIQKKRVFVPISDQFGASRSTFTRPGGGNHWSLMLWEINSLYYEVDGGFSALVGVGFHHFDSSSGFNKSAATAVAKKLHKALCASMSKNDGVADVVEVVECQAPQQSNGHDCGIFALGFADALSASEDYGFVKEQHEELLQTHFEESGGQEEFALGLRKQIADDIRELARKESKSNGNK